MVVKTIMVITSVITIICIIYIYYSIKHYSILSVFKQSNKQTNKTRGFPSSMMSPPDSPWKFHWHHHG